MSSQTLYRKYRPQAFSEVIGQPQVTDILAAQLTQPAHAYLFSGPRGTGKTSVARIFASLLNTAPADRYEMDAASNRGVDDIRELREGVRTLPFDSAYKVYIIDEVHMLTKEAFNALLKTLEEPPAHVIFILATTELEKVPETIISRCQTFRFRAPTIPLLIESIERVAEKEGVTIHRDVTELIARLGDGSFRDTLGVLQKVLSVSTDRVIDADEVTRITGAPSLAMIEALLDALAQGEAATVFTLLNDCATQGVQPILMATLLAEYYRTILLVRANAGAATPFTKKMLSYQSAVFQTKYLALILETLALMRASSEPLLHLEVCLLRILEETAA